MHINPDWELRFHEHNPMLRLEHRLRVALCSMTFLCLACEIVVMVLR